MNDTVVFSTFGDIKKLSNKQLYRLLSLYSKKQIRGFAKDLDVPLGKTKECTLYNLILNRKKFINLEFTIELQSKL